MDGDRNVSTLGATSLNITATVGYSPLANTTDWNTTSWNTTNISYYDFACVMLEDPPSVMLSHRVYLYTSLVLVAIGLLGNTLSVLVFSSKDMRRVSSNVYLLMLAVSDSMYLVCVFLTKTLTTLRCLHFYDVAADIFNRNLVACISLQYLQDLFSDYSTCLILAFTLERFVAVYLPMEFKKICTVLRARLLCVLIFGTICIFIAPYHVMYMGRYHNYNVCTVLLDYEDMFTILYIVEALIFRIIPVVLIAVLNVFIIIKVSKMTSLSKRRHSSVLGRFTSITSKSGKRTKKEDKSLQLTIMLILVSTSYVLVYIPVLVHFVMWKLQRSHHITVSSDAMTIAKNYASALYISGFAINFFLYTVSGRVFREQLGTILCEAKQAASEPSQRNGYTGMITMAETDV